VTIGSPTPPMITDAAAAVAAGKCYLSRNRAPGIAVDGFHPRACEWCAYPLRELAAWLAAFNEWAGWISGEGRYTEPEVRRFANLPKREQQVRAFRAAYGAEVNPSEMRP